jgi:hypothetical protein
LGYSGAARFLRHFSKGNCDYLDIQNRFDAIRQLMSPPGPKKRKIGFLVEEKAAAYGRR